MANKELKDLQSGAGGTDALEAWQQLKAEGKVLASDDMERDADSSRMGSEGLIAERIDENLPVPHRPRERRWAAAPAFTACSAPASAFHSSRRGVHAPARERAVSGSDPALAPQYIDQGYVADDQPDFMEQIGKLFGGKKE